VAQQKRTRPEVTEAQKARNKTGTGQDAGKVREELAVEELEERIAPARSSVGPIRIGPKVG
jgi:hypothetical protein